MQLPPHKLILKSPSSKVASGRNFLSECTFHSCSEKEQSGCDKFPVCLGCKHKRYCTREHQVLDWKRHKAECKESQDRDKLLGIQATSNKLTEAQIICNLLAEFVTLHKPTFQRITNYAYHLNIAGTGVDIRRMYCEANLEYRIDCDQNPGSAFHLLDFRVLQWNEDEMKIKVSEYREQFNMNRRNDSTYIDCMRCIFKCRSDLVKVQNEDWVPLYIEPNPERLTQEWYFSLLRCIGPGIISRKIWSPEKHKLIWASGVFIRETSKPTLRWIWVERARDQIREAGLEIPPIEAWGIPKRSDVIIQPGALKIPYVAPKGVCWEE